MGSAVRRKQKGKREGGRSDDDDDVRSAACGYFACLATPPAYVLRCVFGRERPVRIYVCLWGESVEGKIKAKAGVGQHRESVSWRWIRDRSVEVAVERPPCRAGPCFSAAGFINPLYSYVRTESKGKLCHPK